MASPLVSIITPTYNHNCFIGECIESVLSQTYQNWELLIIDDESSDGTWGIVQQYSAMDRRIRAFRQEHQGIWRLRDTYNFALAKSHGELIAILEGDDYWPPHKLQIQVESHEKIDDLVLSHGRTTFVVDGRATGDYPHPPISGPTSTFNYLRLALLRSACIMPVSVVIKKSTLEEIGGFQQDDGYPAVDYSTWLRLFSSVGSVVWLPQHLGYYRRTASQVTQVLSLPMNEAPLRIALYNFDEHLPPEVRMKLNLSRRSIIRAHYNPTIVNAHLAHMRAALLSREKRVAIRSAFMLIAHGSLRRKIQGLIGIGAALIGHNLEPIFSAYERVLPSGRVTERNALDV